jgi:folate-binding protein YgfZ
MKAAHPEHRISGPMTLPPDYQALHEGAVTGEIAPRGQIAVAGRDRASFLQGLLTNDIQALTPGTGCYAAWLTPQGRLITDMHVLESGDMILLDLPAALVDDILQKLDQFLFSEDVQVSDLRGALRAVWVHGPGAARGLEALLTGAGGIAAWPQYRNARVNIDSAPAVIARIDELGVPGYCVYVDPTKALALAAALQQQGVMPATPATLEAARIEAGLPIFGVDMDGEIIPLEAGIEPRAISFTKGCYVGQEVIIRVLHRGGGRVAKKLVALRLGGTEAAGTKVFAGEKEIGRITSVATSPRFGAIALAYLHRDFLTPGTTVEVEARGGRVPATVSERPITA